LIGSIRPPDKRKPALKGAPAPTLSAGRPI
jgi:hypothetical protein